MQANPIPDQPIPLLNFQYLNFESFEFLHLFIKKKTRDSLVEQEKCKAGAALSQAHFKDVIM